MAGAQARRRRSSRLPGFDYAAAGAYFVTIVTQNRLCLFGEIIDYEMHLNDAGQAIARWWFELERKFTTIETDAFVVMPNHFHGIVTMSDPTVGADLCVGLPNEVPMHPTHPGAHTGAPLPTIIQWFKTMTTNEYIRGVKRFGWPAFQGHLWQRNYYEHIIRDEDSLNRIRQYIVDNPARWDSDGENPTAVAAEAQDSWLSR